MRNLAERERSTAACSGSDGIYSDVVSRAVAGSRRYLINNIKENYCYVLADSQQWATSGGPMEQVKGRVDDTDVVIDGNLVKLGDERFLCTESLFRSDSLDPSTNQEPPCTYSAASIPEMVTNSISRCADDIRELAITFSNIVTVGGTSLLPGFDQRLRSEVCSVLAAKLRIDASQVNLITSCSRQNSAWNGGSALAASLSCTKQWVSRELYDEYGPEGIDDRLLVCM
jgi:actin-related protein